MEDIYYPYFIFFGPLVSFFFMYERIMWNVHLRKKYVKGPISKKRAHSLEYDSGDVVIH